MSDRSPFREGVRSSDRTRYAERGDAAVDDAAAPGVLPARVKRIAYLGTPSVAVGPLRALVAAGFEVAVVVTAPDRRRGRGSRFVSTPVAQAAQELGLTTTHTLDEVADHDVDLGVVVAFGSLIPARLLRVVPMVNLHFSLLPRWRGAAPVERAILAGDDETGVSLMVLTAGLDEGPVVGERRVPIGDATLAELWNDLSELGSEMLCASLAEGFSDPVAQSGTATYAAKLSAEDRRLDWSLPTELCRRVVRLGRAFTTWDGERFLVHAVRPRGTARVCLAESARRDPRASAGDADGARSPGAIATDGDGFPVVFTGDGEVALARVQPAGRAGMAADDWWRGVPPARRDIPFV